MKSKLMTSLVIAAGLTVTSLAAQSAEITFNPGDPTRGYDMDGSDVLHLWGVPEANGQALVGNPDYNWPTVTSVHRRYSTILKAQEMGLSVGVGYDPVTFDIWYVGKPR